jgi:pilus assembly protein Flp/PilA
MENYMRHELKRIAAMLSRLSHDEDGVTAIEYGLLAALIAVAIIAAVSATGDSLAAVYDYWSSAVVDAISS